MPRVTAIIVNYNTRDLLKRCLLSLGEADEVIVVDNASIDGSAEMVRDEFQSAVLIVNNGNRGFGAANNQGLGAMTGDYALLINSDAAAEPGAIRALADVLDARPDLVAVGGRLVSPDGSTQNSTANELTLWAVYCEQLLLEKAFAGNRFTNPYWNTVRLLASGEPVALTEQVMGACILMRPVERFDERFFLYCEDTELCRRLRKHGAIAYVPGARFQHELGASSEGTRWTAVARYNRGKELYFKIHHGRFKAFLAWVYNRKGALLRMLGWLFLAMARCGTDERAKRQVGLFFRVLLAPIFGPAKPADSAE